MYLRQVSFYLNKKARLLEHSGVTSLQPSVSRRGPGTKQGLGLTCRTWGASATPEATEAM